MSRDKKIRKRNKTIFIYGRCLCYAASLGGVIPNTQRLKTQ